MANSINWTELRKELVGEHPKSVLPPKVKLPMLPRALSEFMERVQDPDVDPRELSRIICTDAGLSSELLRMANSPAFGARRQITSVQQALAMLGIRATQMHLTTSALKNAMKSTSSRLIHFETFWNTNLERALLAREVAKLIGADADLAFTAGMLQDYLLPLVTNQLIDKYLEFTENRKQFPDLPTFEQQSFHWDHAKAGAMVMLGWNLPDELVCCVCLHHRGVSLLQDEKLGKTAAAAVAVSCLLPDALCQESDGVTKLAELEQAWEPFELLETAQRVNDEFLQMATNARNHFSFLRACEKTLQQAP